MKFHYIKFHFYRYGSILVKNDGMERGTVFTVIFSVMMGAFALGNVGPHIAKFAAARMAARPIFDIIESVRSYVILLIYLT